MDPAIYGIIRTLAARGRINAKGWINTKCPFCDTRHGTRDRGKALSINPRTGRFMCWRCDLRGRLPLEPGTLVDEPELPPKVEMRLPREYISLAQNRSSLVLRPARAYLRRRRVPDTLWGPLEIGACLTGRLYRHRVVIPVKGPRGELRGFVARSWANENPPHRYPPGMERGTSLFNHTALLQETDVPLIVVEGVFDAIPHLPHAAALLGKPTDDQIALLATTQRPVAFALDGDAWEEGWAWAEHLRFKGVHAGSVKLPPGKDPNDISPTWLARKAKESIKAPEGQ